MFVPCTVQVCNHPDLFERRNVESPISLSIPPYTVPRLLYYNVMMPSIDRNRSVAWLAILYAYNMYSTSEQQNIHGQVFGDSKGMEVWLLHRVVINF